MKVIMGEVNSTFSCLVMNVKHSLTNILHLIFSPFLFYCCERWAGKLVKTVNQPSGTSSEEDNAKKSYTPYIKYTKLNFKVNCMFFFCLSSIIFILVDVDISFSTCLCIAFALPFGLSIFICLNLLLYIIY